MREAVEATPAAKWIEIDIGKNSRRAVDVGVLGTPALAIDGELVFKSAPKPVDLQSAIRARVAKA